MARLVVFGDLEKLINLYEVSDVSDVAVPFIKAEKIWSDILSQENVSVFVSEDEEKIVASCMLVTAPNLLRGGRQHGFLENVVTHPDLQGRGHGTAVVEAALAFAWKQDCYHVLMQSGRSDPRVHRFYERCGFKPGYRTGYVAIRPSGF